MKKYLIIISLLLPLFNFGQANGDKRIDVEEDGLIGKIKQIKETPFDASEQDGKIIEGKTGYYPNMRKYDEKGGFIEEDRYKQDETLNSKTTVKYDDKRNVVEFCEFNADGTLAYKIAYKYDDRGNEIERKRFDGNGVLDDTRTTKYDLHNNTIEECNYDSKGILKEKYTYSYEYDNHGNWIKKTFHELDTFKIIIREIEYY